ncbi:MAG: cysteine rich repeat-containing protein [Pseudomonadota bacterium]
MKATLPIALSTAIFITQFSLSAQADGISFARAGIRHCGGDVSRLCSNVFPGGGRIAQCLLDNVERLSPGCHAFVGKAKTARQVMFACQPDAERYCADVEPGRGRIVRCLDRNRDRLAKSCNRALNRAEAMLQN